MSPTEEAALQAALDGLEASVRRLSERMSVYVDSIYAIGGESDA